jgi:hypothetical protein
VLNTDQSAPKIAKISCKPPLPLAGLVACPKSPCTGHHRDHLRPVRHADKARQILTTRTEGRSCMFSFGCKNYTVNQMSKSRIIHSSEFEAVTFNASDKVSKKRWPNLDASMGCGQPAPGMSG